jgi:hypothetical protein
MILATSAKVSSFSAVFTSVRMMSPTNMSPPPWSGAASLHSGGGRPRVA